MKHLRLFENTEAANNQVVDLPVVALVKGVEKGLVMAPKTEEASEATIKVSASGDITVEPKGGGGDEMFIDLGLPSGLKWAKMNLGANSETEDGHYYMWGSVTPNDETDCKWENSPFPEDRDGSGEEKDYSYLEQYLKEDKETLKPEYDAAQVAGVGRMPTKADFDELLSNTTNEWYEDYQGSGVNGRLFTASNGNSIFIPASGYRNGSDFNFRGLDAGVWSSSLYTDGPNDAWGLYFFSDSCSMNFNIRFDGYSVRPVSE